MTSNFTTTLNMILADNQLDDYLAALGVFIATFLIAWLARIIIIARLGGQKSVDKPSLTVAIATIVKSIGWFFYLTLALALASYFIALPENIRQYLSHFIFIVLACYFTLALYHLVDYGVFQLSRKINKERHNRLDEAASKMLGTAIKITLWVIAIIVILQNIGYNVSALIAGLGIGGIAIAFAMQNILSDIFASLAIYFDKPFQIGDFITVNNKSGTVKAIGVKSTRLQTLQGEELIIANKDLTGSRVHNYKTMTNRRIVFHLGIAPATPAASLRQVNAIITDAIRQTKQAKLSRVHFYKFGTTALEFEIVYEINTGNYQVYMDTQQEINLGIKEKLEQAGISLAYSTAVLLKNNGR